jgi:outer membrane cobalamin receptor
MDKHYLSLIYLVLLTSILASPVQANDSYSAAADSTALNMKGTDLPEVHVVGNVKRYEEVIPSQKLSGEQLDALNSHNVADAIRYFSGVQIKDYGGVGGVKTVDIRSMGTNHLGVFYDGIQLGNAQNGQIDLGKYSLDNIEEISMYNGQKSEIFQSAKDYGSAGTIYLRTRRPVFKEGKRFNLNVTMRTGSFGLANPSFRLEYKINRNLSATFNAEYTYANGRYKFRYRKMFSDGSLAWDTTATRRNGDIHSFRTEGAIFGKINRGRWYAKFYYFDSEKGIPGAIVNNVWKNSQRQWDKNFFAQGSWQKGISDRYEMMINAKYARDYMRYLNPDTTLMYLDNKFWQDEIYISTAHKYKILDNWDANLSVDWQWNHLDATLANFAYPTRHTVLAAIATAWRLNGFKAQASGLGTFVIDRAKVNNGYTLKNRTSHFNEFTPALFLSYQPFEDKQFNIRAYYKRIFRMPTFNDLYYTDIGNVDLKPEYVTQYDLGAMWRTDFSHTVFRSFNISADGYINHISDKIIAVPKGTGQYRWMMMNIGKVRITGLDVTAKLECSLPADIMLNGQLTYTFQKALDYSDPSDCLDAAGTYKGQIAYIPEHSGSAILSLYYHGLNLNYSWIYVGERYHTSSNIPENYEQPWYTHDISASYLFNIGKTRIKATLEVNNLLNQQYEVIMNYPMPGRNFKAILQFDI